MTSIPECHQFREVSRTVLLGDSLFRIWSQERCYWGGAKGVNLELIYFEHSPRNLFGKHFPRKLFWKLLIGKLLNWKLPTWLETTYERHCLKTSENKHE